MRLLAVLAILLVIGMLSVVAVAVFKRPDDKELAERLRDKQLENEILRDTLSQIREQATNMNDFEHPLAMSIHVKIQECESRIRKELYP